MTFAARNLLRQPGRATVGVLGIAAVGALLFDMLLLSHGLVVSFRDLLNSIGYDVRVLTTDAAPIGGPRLHHVTELVAELARLPEISEIVPIRVADAEALQLQPPAPHAAGAPLEQRRNGGAGATAIGFSLTAMDPRLRRPWTVIEGREPESAPAQSTVPALLINRQLADALSARPGDTVAVRVTCASDRAALPSVPFRISGIADFPFDNAVQLTGVASRASVLAACGDRRDASGRYISGADDDADLLLIASSEGYGAEAAVSAIRRVRPDLHPATNEEIVTRMQRQGFTYFRQISAVLSTITMLFGFLLITVLLTVSVNQRLGEIAALRALGFSRARVAADVLCQSALLVGAGGVLALPLGAALSMWLDRILKGMPGIPEALHFFVFEPRAIELHALLLVLTAILAAAYPVRLVTNLPIAATLRNEVIG